MDWTLKIISTTPVTHDVRCIRLEKPAGYQFTPGEATEVALDQEGWQSERRPFTFTSLNEDPYLEFTIKCYRQHDGVTNQIAQLQTGDSLIVGEPWGTIAYKGPGYFIAGGAGITPFIAILRQLQQDGRAAGNRLFFANKTPRDIIYEQELRTILDKEALFVVTDQTAPGYLHGYINNDFLRHHVSRFDVPFYICGPDAMVAQISGLLIQQGAQPDALTFEK